VGRKLHFKMGSFYRISDRTGFAVRAEETRQEWNQLIVETKVWEARQPQDLVRGVPDDQSVPDARPLAPAVYVGPVSQATSAAAVVGQTVLQMQSVSGFYANAPVGCMLDTGVVFRTTLVGNPGSSFVTLAAKLPASMASGNLVTVYQPSPGVEPGLP
jgi:hypothetical protein